MKKILLIDGNSLVFRAYYATKYSRSMTTQNGLPTNALYGFIAMAKKAIEQINPDECLVAFDAGKKTFRHDLFKEYKGTRKPVDDELKAQFPLIREYLTAAGINQYEQVGIEADDIIGTMAKRCSNCETNILTGDKDLLQLVDESTCVWMMQKGISEMTLYDEEMVLERFNLKPIQIIDLKGLMGDNSDNIPGLYKVGEKTAIKLLEEYHSVEGVIANVDKLKGKLKENVENNADIALLSKRLATIKTDCDFVLPDDLSIKKDYQKEQNFYAKYELKSFMGKNDNQKVKEVKTAYIQIKEIPNEFYQNNLVINIIHNGVDSKNSIVEGIAVSNSECIYYLKYEDAIKDEGLKKYLASDLTKIIFDVKAAYHMLDGIFTINNAFDVMIAGFLVKGHISNFDELVVSYNGSFSVTLKDIFGSNNQVSLFIDEEKLQQYLIEYSQFVAQIYPELIEQIETLDMHQLYYDIELPVAKILFEMEKTGVNVSSEVLDKIASECLIKTDALSKEIYEYANCEFNINSPKQLAQVLYDQLNLPAASKRSTAVEALTKLQYAHPIINIVLEYRKYQKLYSTYASGLKKFISSDHKIHTQFNQCIAQTGRLSSTSPNLQNISVRNEETREVRKAFLPSEGNCFISADYSQVELRILAHVANEEKLIQAFRSGIDIHTKTAMDVFNISEGEMTPLLRRHAKAINFGIIYGMSDFGLAEDLGISRMSAKNYIETYFATYPRIKEYLNSVVDFCKNNGYVLTMFNRRREINEINSSNHQIREFGKRAAMNAPIQGSAADLIKVAMINVDKRMKKEGVKAKMILQVHDELIFDVPLEEKALMLKLVKEEMENALTLKVPLLVECAEGNSWYEAK